MIDKGCPVDPSVLRPAEYGVDKLRFEPGDKRAFRCRMLFSPFYSLPDLRQPFGVLLQLFGIPGKPFFQRLSTERLAEPAGLKRRADPLPSIVQCSVHKAVVRAVFCYTLYLVDADVV